MKKRLFAWICLVLMLTGMLCGCDGKNNQEPVQTQAPVLTPAKPAQQEQPAEGDTFTVYAYTPDDWTDIRIWAWSDNQGDLSAAWPGEAMQDDGYGWYAYEVPRWVDKVIINGNGGAVQTADLDVESRDLWILVYDDASISISYTDPAEEAQWGDVQPEQDGYYKVYAKVNTGWTDVALWVWSETEGDLVPTWPGILMDMGSDGWYVLDIPVAYDNVIVNGNGGTAQTEDLYTGGSSVWITVDHGGTDVSYSKPSDASASTGTSSGVYEYIFSSRGLSDVRVVSSSLQEIAAVSLMDGGFQKQEYGHTGNETMEFALTIYFDVTGQSTDNIRAAQQWLQDTYGPQTAGMNFCTTSCDRIGNYLRYIMYFRNLDDSNNVRQLLSFIGVDSSALNQNGRLPVPTAAEMEGAGFVVKGR